MVAKKQIRQEWKRRAQREDVLAVMSARHSLADNQKASSKMIDDIMAFLEMHYGSLEGKRVLELGCGTGRFTRELGKKAREVVAVDMTPEMIERARTYTCNLKNIKYRIGRIADLDMQQLGQFDLAFESITLLHILDEKEYRKSIEVMKTAAPYVFICEHMADSAPVSSYSALRSFDEYVRDFEPLSAVAYRKDHFCVTDWFPMILFKKE